MTNDPWDSFTIEDYREFYEGESLVFKAVEQAAREVNKMIEDRIQEAAAEGYDYLYVVHDYGTRDLAQERYFGGERVGEGLTPKIRTLASSLPPEHFLWVLDMHGSARVYDLSELTDDEREQVANGNVPPSLTSKGYDDDR